MATLRDAVTGMLLLAGFGYLLLTLAGCVPAHDMTKQEALDIMKVYKELRP